MINIGTGEDLTIRELAELVARVLDFECELIFDTSRAGWHSAEASRCQSNPCARMEGEGQPRRRNPAHLLIRAVATGTCSILIYRLG